MSLGAAGEARHCRQPFHSSRAGLDTACLRMRPVQSADASRRGGLVTRPRGPWPAVTRSARRLSLTREQTLGSPAVRSCSSMTCHVTASVAVAIQVAHLPASSLPASSTRASASSTILPRCERSGGRGGRPERRRRGHLSQLAQPVFGARRPDLIAAAQQQCLAHAAGGQRRESRGRRSLARRGPAAACARLSIARLPSPITIARSAVRSNSVCSRLRRRRLAWRRIMPTRLARPRCIVAVWDAPDRQRDRGAWCTPSRGASP